MGKGDKKTKKGKITSGSFGVSRKRKKSSGFVPSKPKAKKETTETKEAAPKKAPAKKTTAKKATTKKAPAKKATAEKK